MTTVFAVTKEDTQNAGKSLARRLRAGDVILLSGRMGAGKSEFARGVARGLGITSAVPSPSFTIGDESELTDMGLDEYIGGDGVTLIEWHERAEDLIPETALEVLLSPQEDGSRIITLIPHGRWEAEHR